MTSIIVDGVTYQLAIDYKSIKREFSIKEGPNASETITGKTIRDILGTGYTYSMTVQPMPGHISDYDDFYQVITSPVDSHIVTLPYGQDTITFEAQIISGSDEYLGYYEGYKHWGDFSITFIPIKAQRSVM